MEKIIVSFVGEANPESENEVWGGSKATFNAFSKSFENDDIFEIRKKDRSEIKTHVDIVEHIKNSDISHVDGTNMVMLMYNADIPPPDIIGPIARSPLKHYNSGENPPYTKEWFYQSKVIRLNYNEEKNNKDLVTLIRHGIDTDRLLPTSNPNRKYVLWAGMIPRYAKNYELMEEIMSVTNLPQPYEFKVLSNYNVIDYWKILDETAIFVNTSRYESFCNALFEARSRGVATIQPKLLNGVGVHEDAPVQVEYSATAYRDKILELLDGKKYFKVGEECRKYCVDTASLRVMRDDIAKVYLSVLEEKSKR